MGWRRRPRRSRRMGRARRPSEGIEGNSGFRFAIPLPMLRGLSRFGGSQPSVVYIMCFQLFL